MGDPTEEHNDINWIFSFFLVNSLAVRNIIAYFKNLSYYKTHFNILNLKNSGETVGKQSLTQQRNSDLTEEQLTKQRNNFRNFWPTESVPLLGHLLYYSQVQSCLNWALNSAPHLLQVHMHLRRFIKSNLP